MPEKGQAGSPALPSYYPPVNFIFQVHFEDLGDQGDVGFQTVSGLNAQIQTETIKEGGENLFEHVVPVRTKFSDLQLKRGLLQANSPVTSWIRRAVENFNFEPVNLTITLLNELQEPLMVWYVFHAWPKNWKIGDFNAERGEVMVESIDLAYNNFRMRNP